MEETVGMIVCAATVVIVIVLNEGPSVDLISLRVFLLLPNTKWSSGKLKTSKVWLEMHYHFYCEVLQKGLDCQGSCPEVGSGAVIA